MKAAVEGTKGGKNMEQTVEAVIIFDPRKST